ncbi:peptide deformylase [Natranaerovirga pectinivora]|uniref:Peptide deformylase n=1 Tax=Natranaerovirga pectinivora TaxID=682400 RepID=A0A4R3MQ05_9FIRM|nr:peptide deformylase [Natranaerovirga pectinivora]TCT16942.1 peptide deformylase [Natranaerovirga pectinivora]
MAIRNIREDGDEVLRKKARVVESITDQVKVLIDDMIETMYDANGIGLAAPQVGILKRIIVIDIGEGLVVLINPEIVERNGCQVGIEGCLSIPGTLGEIERPEYVKVKGLNKEGETIFVEGTELMAKALCHEIDHLDGVLFTDKVIRFVDGYDEDEMEE